MNVTCCQQVLFKSFRHQITIMNGDGWTDGWMGGWLDGWMGGWLDGWIPLYLE
jgi:hypothetical protein